MMSPVEKAWENLPQIVKQVITVVLFIVAISLMIWILRSVKDKVEDNQLDQYKDRPTGDTSRDPRQLVDNIFTKLNDPNFFVYPDVVNLLVKLSSEELTIAYNYFDREYRQSVGMSLTEFIDDEWDGGHYAPAIEKLQRHGLL